VRTLWIAALTLGVFNVGGGVGVAGAETAQPLRSYWNPAHSAIVSDVRVVRDDGSVEEAQVAGGTVDGITMVQIPLGLGVEFVRTANKFGSRLHWSGACAFISVDAAGTRQLTLDAETKAIQAAMDAWNDQPACSYMRYMMAASERLEVGYDGKNTIKFRDDRWCRPGLNCPDDCAKLSQPSQCPIYKGGATAITTLFFVERQGAPDDGTILDADTEINAVNFAMAVGCETQCLTMATRGVVEDLQNTMTHEFGHMLGLAHTCDDIDDPYVASSAPKDDQGQPIPCCNAECDFGLLPAKVTDATMYNFQDAMETKKRTLSQDDINAVCAVYPSASDPHVCAPVQISSSGGCSVGGEPSIPGGVVALALAALLVTVRACSRSRRR
jgi:reprolysin-like metallo-peptidase family M12B